LLHDSVTMSPVVARFKGLACEYARPIRFDKDKGEKLTELFRRESTRELIYMSGQCKIRKRITDDIDV